MKWSKENIPSLATQVRRDILRMVHGVNSGHPGGSLGCADLLSVLFFHTMHYNSQNFNKTGTGEDVFYLSNGHISPLFYSVLARAGFFDLAELSTFRKIDSRLQGHPTNHEGLPGIRVASGSLGQGVSVACGTALAKRMAGDDKHVFVLTGDGELEEGQVWEAFMFAAHHKLGNLIAIVDDNGQQIDGTVEQVMGIEPLADKLKAFGWAVLKMNGHDVGEIISTLEEAKKQGKNQSKPVVILMKTIMGKGVDFMENDHKWHGTAPNNEQLEKALQQLVVNDSALQDYPSA